MNIEPDVHAEPESRTESDAAPVQVPVFDVNDYVTCDAGTGESVVEVAFDVERFEREVIEPAIAVAEASDPSGLRHFTRTYLVNKQNVRVSVEVPVEAKPTEINAIFASALREVCVERFGEIKPGTGRLRHLGDHRYEWRR